MNRLLIIAALAAIPAAAQGPYPFTRQPLNITNIPNITSANALDCAPAIGVIDNRSTVSRTNDYHGFAVVATGIWTVSMSYSDNSCSGPWTSFGSAASLSNSSPVPWIGFGEGYHAFLQFVVTGNASVTYGGTKNMFYPAVSSGAQFPITWTGPWSSLTTYAINSIVSYNGQTFIALVSNTNVTPINGATWQIFIPGGATGSASMDLCGSYPGPTVCGIDGVSILGISGLLKLTAGSPSVATPGTDYVGTLPSGIVLGNGTATGTGVTATGGSQALVSNPSNTGYLFSAIPGVGATGTQTQFLRITPNSGNNTTYSFSSLPTLLAADYNFPSQSPGGSLGVGFTVITVSPVPLGVSGSDTGHSVYVSGGVGTAESCLISGGTAVSGSSSGTLIIQCVGTHSGAWTVQSMSGGLQEAICALPTAGGEVWFSSSITLNGNVTACGKTQPTVRKLAGASVTGSSYTILGSSTYTNSDEANVSGEVATGSQTFAPVLNQSLNLTGIQFEPTITGSGNTSILGVLNVIQDKASLVSSPTYLNGLYISMNSSNTQPYQNAAVIGFWYSNGGADPFGGDFRGVVPSTATAAPHYAIGLQGTAEVDNATYPPSQFSTGLLAACSSSASVLCNYGLFVSGTGDHFLISNDTTSMQGEGIVLIPANDSNPGFRAFGITNAANTKTTFYGSKNGTVYANAGVVSAGFNAITAETGSGTGHIAGSLLDTGITNGASGPIPDMTCVVVHLQHGLNGSLGANDFALNGGAAIAIKSHYNITLNINTGYNIGSSFYACYNQGNNVWEDMSQ